jgi:hypothetical protein
MNQIIGKYTIYEDVRMFKIRYRYSFSDLTGSFWFLLSLALGTLMLITFIKTVDSSNDSWFLLLLATGLIGYGTYFLSAVLCNPINGVLQINKVTHEVIIRDLFKSETIKSNSISSVFYEITRIERPRTLYAMLTLRLTDGTKMKCFIIRTSHSIDIGRKVEKDLHTVARQIRDKISNALK